MGEAGIVLVGQVDLAGVAGHHHAGALAQAGQHHLHLQARAVLGLVDDDEGVGEGAAAHEGDGGELDLTLLAAATELVGAQDVGQGLPDGRHIGIDLFGQVSGQEAQALAGLDGGAGDDQPVNLAAQQQARAMGHGQEGLAGAGGTQAEHQLAAGQRLQIAGLGGGLGRHLAATAAGQGARRRAATHPHLADGHPDVGLGDLEALVGALGDGLDHPLGVGAALGFAAHRGAAAGGFDQHVEGVLDQGGVTAGGSGHGAGAGVGQGDEFGGLAHAGSSARASARVPARLILAAASTRTWTTCPMRVGEPSKWTAWR